MLLLPFKSIQDHHNPPHRSDHRLQQIHSFQLPPSQQGNLEILPTICGFQEIVFSSQVAFVSVRAVSASALRPATSAERHQADRWLPLNLRRRANQPEQCFFRLRWDLLFSPGRSGCCRYGKRVDQPDCGRDSRGHLPICTSGHKAHQQQRQKSQRGKQGKVQKHRGQVLKSRPFMPSKTSVKLHNDDTIAIRQELAKKITCRIKLSPF